MRIAVSSDHAGFVLRGKIVKLVNELGHEAQDLGPSDPGPVDYPDIAGDVARALQEGRADRGILVCGSGAGACVAANKFREIRAAQAHDTYTAHQCVEHDDVNVLCLGERVVGVELAAEIVRTFLAARFSGDERHVRRLDKIKTLEDR